MTILVILYGTHLIIKIKNKIELKYWNIEILKVILYGTHLIIKIKNEIELKVSETFGAGTDHCWGSPEIPRELRFNDNFHFCDFPFFHILHLHHDHDGWHCWEVISIVGIFSFIIIFSIFKIPSGGQVVRFRLSLVARQVVRLGSCVRREWSTPEKTGQMSLFFCKNPILAFSKCCSFHLPPVWGGWPTHAGPDQS